jgi:hypothetical protein
MSSPIGLTIKNNSSDMQIGDCIPCRYTALTSGSIGNFSEFGTSTVVEIPLTGTATPDGLFYFIKVAKGTLVADRVIQHSISWDTINAAKFIEGKTTTLNSINYLICSLSGGCTFLNTNGIDSSTTDNSLGGFPNINEFDNYIRLSTLNNKISAGSDSIWHWSNLYTLCKDTPITTLASSSTRIYRGKDSLTKLGTLTSSTTNITTGFRPVLKYVESNIQSIFIY